jgi:NADPH:quinone reductase-like Zn-dependent oxidoreductase
MGKRLHLIGSTLRSRPPAEKIAITRRFEQEVWPKLVSGELRPIIDTIFPIEEAQSAHAYVLADRNTGKVILAVRPGAA